MVVVKAWEPPMGELQDFLNSIDREETSDIRLLLPLDWDNEGFREVSDSDLHEWRRFAGTLSGWSVLQLDATARGSE